MDSTEPQSPHPWTNECLKIAHAEVRKAAKRGLPPSIDRRDLESQANEVIAELEYKVRDGVVMRARIRSRLLDLIRRELSRGCECTCPACRESRCSDCENAECRSRLCADAGCEKACGMSPLPKPSAGLITQVSGSGASDPEYRGNGGENHTAVSGADSARMGWDSIETLLTPTDLDIVVALFIDGHSQADLAKELGISRSALHKRLKRITEQIREKAPAMYTRLIHGYNG
jgi:AraC-like DNA-binding protein